MPIAPPVLIAPSGEVAEPKNFADSPVAGQYLQIDAGARTWRWGAGGLTTTSMIAQTLVVDAVNFSATPTGGLAAPYATLQAAIAQAVALAWTYVNILVAPATYADPVAIPAGLQVAFTGWGKNATAILGGDITITGGVGSSDQVSFENCIITAANITAADPLTQDIDLNFYDCECLAVISGFNVLAFWQASSQLGNVNAGGGLTTSWDDWSWSHTLNAAPVFTVGGVYTRGFWGTGHDVYMRGLAAAAVPVFPAVGSTVFVAMAVPAHVRADDRVSIQVDDPAVQDFICGVHGVTAGVVTAWLTNLSRVAGNFAEPIHLTIHHGDMVSE